MVLSPSKKIVFKHIWHKRRSLTGTIIPDRLNILIVVFIIILIYLIVRLNVRLLIICLLLPITSIVKASEFRVKILLIWVNIVCPWPKLTHLPRCTQIPVFHLCIGSVVNVGNGHHWIYCNELYFEHIDFPDSNYQVAIGITFKITDKYPVIRAL